MTDTAPTNAGQWTARVRENVVVARDTLRMRIDAPALAAAVRPGQFLMLRPAGGTDPLLGRPFALWDVVRDESGTPVGIDVIYIVLGRGTRALSERKAGDRVSVWGPLGNGFGAPPAGGSVVCVAGGIGQTPFLALAYWWTGRSAYGGREFAPGARADRVDILYGVRSADLLAGVTEFRAAGMGVEIATDDGSAGSKGFVTDLLRARLERGERPAKVLGCGPPPMLAALAMIAEAHGLDCDLSLENHMACGYGACFSCVAPIRQEDGSTDLRRVCVEGPIFPAKDVVTGGGH